MKEDIECIKEEMCYESKTHEKDRDSNQTYEDDHHQTYEKKDCCSDVHLSNQIDKGSICNINDARKQHGLSQHTESESDIDDGQQNTVDLSNQTDQGKNCNINDVHKGHGLNKYTESESNIVDGQQNTVDLSNQMDQGSICNINDVCKQHGPSIYIQSLK